MISDLENQLGISFSNISLLEQAVTTSAFANENKTKSYQRLEFLGDGILSFVIGAYLFEHYPLAEEGELTRRRANIVNGTRLDQVGRALSLERYAKIPSKVIKSSSYRIPYEDMVEAIIGAIYLDKGLDTTKDIIFSLFHDYLDQEILEKDEKTILQEFYHEKYHKNVVFYRLISDEGLDNDKTFKVELQIDGRAYNLGIGKSIKKAEKNAAARHLQEYVYGKK